MGEMVDRGIRGGAKMDGEEDLRLYSGRCLLLVWCDDLAGLLSL